MLTKLTKEEQIVLRDELIDDFNKLSILVYLKSKKWYKIKNRTSFQNVLNDNIELKEKYNKYINDFASEEEAIWCLCHRVDISDHICPVCKKNYCLFFEFIDYKFCIIIYIFECGCIRDKHTMYLGGQ